MTNACGICGDLVRTDVPPNWHPSKQLLRAQRDMRIHMQKHTFAEVLLFEIRQDLDQVPEEQRPSIIRDVYRALLGRVGDAGAFSFGPDDGVGAYSIDEALGSVDLYRLWLSHNTCGLRDCPQHE